MAEGEAKEFFLWIPGPASLTRKTSVFVRSLPVAASSESTRSDVLFSVAVVSQIVLSTMEGLDQPLPGTGTFQRTSWVSVHVTGRPFSAEWP